MHQGETGSARGLTSESLAMGLAGAGRARPSGEPSHGAQNGRSQMHVTGFQQSPLKAVLGLQLLLASVS